MAEKQRLTFDYDAGLTEIYIPATDATIKLNLEDIGLYKRVQDTFEKIDKIIISFSKSAEEVQKLKSELGEDSDEFLTRVRELLDQQDQADKDIRAMLATCFGFDIASAVFGAMSCLSSCKSAPTVLHSFMEYLGKIYSDSMAKLGAESDKRIEKYLQKYGKKK